MTMQKINDIMTTAELLKAEKAGWKLFGMLDLLQFTDAQLKQLSSFDVNSTYEKYRAGKKDAKLPEIRDDKYFDDENRCMYLLSEIACDPFLAYLFKDIKCESKIYQFIFAICEYLSGKNAFSSSTLYWIIARHTPLDADAVVNAYDIDRARGRKRCAEYARQAV